MLENNILAKGLSAAYKNTIEDIANINETRVGIHAKSLLNSANGIFDHYPIEEENAQSERRMRRPENADLSLSDFINESNIQIYPNPANNYLVVSSKNTAIKNYSITDLTGKILVKDNYIGRIEIGNLESGVYFISVNDGVKLHKFVKM